MSPFLAGITGLFVRPPRAPGDLPAPGPSAERAIGVLGTSGRQAVTAGAAVALAAARTARRPCAVLCGWPPAALEDVPWSVPPTFGVRRLERSLSARGLIATASGRLVRVVLPAEPEEAASAAVRATAAARAPTVVVVAGPRPPELEAVLGELDLLLVAAEEETLAALALEALAVHRRPAAVCPVRPGGFAGALAAAGLDLAVAHRDLRPVLAEAEG